MKHSTYRDARQALDKGETNCETLVSSFFKEIEAANKELNIFISSDKEDALSRAREIDQMLAQGVDLPLAGMISLAWNRPFSMNQRLVFIPPHTVPAINRPLRSVSKVLGSCVSVRKL